MFQSSQSITSTTMTSYFRFISCQTDDVIVTFLSMIFHFFDFFMTGKSRQGDLKSGSSAVKLCDFEDFEACWPEKTYSTSFERSEMPL